MDSIPESDDVDFETFSRCYLASIKGQLRSWRFIAWRMGRLGRSLAGRTLRGIKRVDIARYVDERRAEGLSNNSINLELSTLSAAIGYANRHWDWELPNPVRGQRQRIPEGRTRHLSPAEVQALIRASIGPRRSPYLADFIRLAANTGCRKTELLTLRWEVVDFPQCRMHVECEYSKNGKRRTIPLNDAAILALHGRLDYRNAHCPLSPWVFCFSDGSRVQRLDKAFKNAVKRAGIEDFRIHDLRHTFASLLVTNDVPLYQVKELLGHYSIVMTERYAHLASSALRRAVNVLDTL